MAARVACVCAPELALQVLLRDRPAWRRLPVALVEDDRPDAPLAALNDVARRAGLAEGMRHGAARDLLASLRTATVPTERLAEAAGEVAAALRALSPKVEPDAARPGVFLVDPTGMGRLHRDVRAWALAARRAVAARGIACSVAVGFDRRAARAVACHARGVVVARSPHEERALAARVPLAALGLPPRPLAELAALGVATLGDLWSLPPESVRHRFGDVVAALRAWASDCASLPVQPDVPEEPVRAVLEVEPPDDDLGRLLFALRGALHLVASSLAARGEAAAALRLAVTLEDHTRREHRVEPASPTRDVALLVELTRLRLGAEALPARVAEVAVEAEAAPLRGEQLALFPHERARDPAAVARAIARVRSAFGDASVTRARLRDAHLPEARFAWEPVGAAPLPHRASRDGEGPGMGAPLVRRLRLPPEEIHPAELRALSPVDPRGAALPWLDAAAANDAAGERPAVDPWSLATPSRVSGGWWGGREVTRDYYYAEARDGRLLWVFHDVPRERWFVHGVVD